jgi:hypothetical protein
MLIMKKTIATTLALAVACLISVNGAETPKEKTVTGTGKCAKCLLKQSDTCQNVIEVKKGNKTTIYTLADNDVSKDFHKNICKEAKDVKATFTITEDKGKKVFTAKKIELVK